VAGRGVIVLLPAVIGGDAPRAPPRPMRLLLKPVSFQENPVVVVSGNIVEVFH